MGTPPAPAPKNNPPLLEIRIAQRADFEAIWNIFRAVIAGGDTYAYSPDTSKAEASAILMGEHVVTYVALDEGETVGAYFMKANQPGLGSHVVNAGYMVAPAARGRGIAKAMCRHSLEAARAAGYLAMQFNIVVSTNRAAIRAWESCGFRIIGTTPRAFRHAVLGFVDAHIMYREL